MEDIVPRPWVPCFKRLDSGMPVDATPAMSADAVEYWYNLSAIVLFFFLS